MIVSKYCAIYGARPDGAEVWLYSGFVGSRPSPNLKYAVDACKPRMYLFSGISEYAALGAPPSLTAFTHTLSSGEDGGGSNLVFGRSNLQRVGARETVCGQVVVCSKQDVADGDAFFDEVLAFGFLPLAELLKADTLSEKEIFRKRPISRTDVSRLPEARQILLCRIASQLMQGQKIALQLPATVQYEAACEELLFQLFELIPARDRCEISFSTARKAIDFDHLTNIQLVITDATVERPAGDGRLWLNSEAAGEWTDADERMRNWCRLPLSERRDAEASRRFSGDLAADAALICENFKNANAWWEQPEIPDERRFRSLTEIKNEIKRNFLLSRPGKNAAFWSKIEMLAVYDGNLAIDRAIEGLILDDIINRQGRMPTEAEIDGSIRELGVLGMSEAACKEYREACMTIKDMIDDIGKKINGVLTVFAKDTDQKFSGIDQRVGGLSGEIGQLGNTVGQVAKKTDQLGERVGALAVENTQKYERTIERLDRVAESAGSNLDRIDRSLADMQSSVQQSADAQKRIDRSVNEMRAQLNSMSEVSREMTSVLAEMKPKLAELNALSRRIGAVERRASSKLAVLLSVVSLMLALLLTGVTAFSKIQDWKKAKDTDQQAIEEFETTGKEKTKAPEATPSAEPTATPASEPTLEATKAPSAEEGLLARVQPGIDTACKACALSYSDNKAEQAVSAGAVGVGGRIARISDTAAYAMLHVRSGQISWTDASASFELNSLQDRLPVAMLYQGDLLYILTVPKLDAPEHALASALSMAQALQEALSPDGCAYYPLQDYGETVGKLIGFAQPFVPDADAQDAYLAKLNLTFDPERMLFLRTAENTIADRAAKTETVLLLLRDDAEGGYAKELAAAGADVRRAGDDLFCLLDADGAEQDAFWTKLAQLLPELGALTTA